MSLKGFKKLSKNLNIENESIQEDQHYYINSIKEEYNNGFLLLNSIGQISATFFGGSRIEKGDKTYDFVYKLAKHLAIMNFTIVTGGGPGVMEAGLEGAKSGGSRSIGIGVDLESEMPSTFASDFLMLDHFSVRKFLLRQSDYLFFFPGGIGTLDELFEVLTLADTNKLNNKKIFLCSSGFYLPIIEMIKNLKEGDKSLISDNLLSRFAIIDSCQDFVDYLEEGK